MSLARKYRPKTFKELLGQDVICQIFENAFSTDKIPQGIVLHGIRGIGKTTTARIVARTLNCRAPDPKNRPCLTCESCIAMDTGSHLDVMEIDAASHTSVESMRNIIDSVRYKAVLGAYKIFIIDEAHMLSKSAFNALLKTLEEPPPHVVFILATTEMHKIPTTILSRCQKFELRPFDIDQIVSNLTKILDTEQKPYEEEGVRAIARYSNGSMRDALSLCDQMISHGSITSKTVQDTVGSVDYLFIIDLIEHILKGNTSVILGDLLEIFKKGRDPLMLIVQIMDVLYWIICEKNKASSMKGLLLNVQEEEKARYIVDQLPIAVFLQFWQILLKGYRDLKTAPNDEQAACVLLLQLCYVKDVLHPGNTSSLLPQESVTTTQPPTTQGLALALTEEDITIKTLEDLVMLLENKKEFILKTHLLRDMVITEVQKGSIKGYISKNLPSHAIKDLCQKLGEWTKMPWRFEILEKDEALLNHPVIQILKEHFPEGIAFSK